MSAMRTGVLPAVCVLLSAICLASVASAQTNWTRTYGGAGDDEGYSVQQTNDGGYIVAGYTNSFGAGSRDAYLIKTNAWGDTLWTKTYGGPLDDCARSVQQTTDGGYIITGWIRSSFTEEDVYLIKTDSRGDTLWTRTYGGLYDDEGASVQQTTDGGYIITGSTGSFGPGAQNYSSVYLIRTDPSGDTLWTRAYGSDSVWEEGSSVQQTTDGGYVIACLGGGALSLIKTDAQGDTLWTRNYGDGFCSVTQTTDGGYIMTGWGVCLVKSNSSGDTTWTRDCGGATGSSVQQTADGDYIIAGFSFRPGNVGTNVYLVKTNAFGDTLWTRTYGGYGDDYGWSVKQTTDGDYVIAGYTASFGLGANDVYLVKTNGELDVGPVAIMSPRGSV